MTRLPEKNGEHPYGDTGQLVLLGLFLLVWTADSFFLKFSTFLAAHIPLFIRLLFLAAALAVAGWLTKSGHIVLRHDKPKGVIAKGAFKYTRHPLYFSALLFYIGLSILSVSLFACAVTGIMIFPFYQYIARYEEELMLSKHGKKYRDYMKQVSRW